MIRIAKVAAVLAVLAVLAFCLAANLGNAPNKGEIDRANRESALTLITALQTFHQAHAVYPSELEALVPDLLATLPTVRPADGSFSYTVRADGADFTLAYPEAALGMLPSDAEYQFKASTGAWTHEVY